MSALVCIVEDDAALLASMKFSLEAEGFVARCFATVSELLSSRMKVLDVDCFVVDQLLPDVTGVEFVEQLRRDHVEAPVILITTNPGQALRTRAENLGVVIVEKPLLGDAVSRAIRALIVGKAPTS